METFTLMELTFSWMEKMINKISILYIMHHGDKCYEKKITVRSKVRIVGRGDVVLNRVIRRCLTTREHLNKDVKEVRIHSLK